MSCSDNDCIFGHEGVGTTGGCRCLRELDTDRDRCARVKGDIKTIIAERNQQARFVNEWRQKAFEAKDELNKLQARVRELEALSDRMLSEVAMNDVSGYLTRRLEALMGEE